MDRNEADNSLKARESTKLGQKRLFYSAMAGASFAFFIGLLSAREEISESFILLTATCAITVCFVSSMTSLLLIISIVNENYALTSIQNGSPSWWTRWEIASGPVSFGVGFFCLIYYFSPYALAVALITFSLSTAGMSAVRHLIAQNEVHSNLKVQYERYR